MSSIDKFFVIVISLLLLIALLLLKIERRQAELEVYLKESDIVVEPYIK